MPGVTSCAGAAGTARPQGPGAAFVLCVACCKKRATRAGESALTLLVAQVLADHHDPAMTADHLALVANLLDAGLNLHLPAVLIGLSRTRPADAGRPRVSQVDREWVFTLKCSPVKMRPKDRV